jgi:hypothetical protein
MRRKLERLPSAAQSLVGRELNQQCWLQMFQRSPRPSERKLRLVQPGLTAGLIHHTHLRKQVAEVTLESLGHGLKQQHQATQAVALLAVMAK